MTFADFIYIFGAIGVFIYGMILLSESLEKAAGEKLKSVLSHITNNKFSAILTGLIVTCVVQSSSATTVMVVSFVNAGLLSLGQAIGVIMGANIGTTTTAWLISLTHMKVNITVIAYVAIVVGIILLFMKKRKVSSFGYCLIGFGFMFIGLELLKNAVPAPDPTNTDNFLYTLLMNIPQNNYFSLIIFMLIGTIFTMIVQSSAVTMAFVLTLAASGYIDFYHAAAIVLGENIGTTITAILASLAGNKMAKKAALAHCLFNVIGVLWVLIPPCYNFLIFLCQRYGGNNISLELALFHTFFNVLNVAILMWFIPYFEKLLNYKSSKSIKYSLLDFDKGIISSSDIAMLEVTKEIEKLAENTENEFLIIDSLLSENCKDKEIRIQDLHKMKEELTDKNREVSTFLNKMLEGNLSVSTISNINKMLFSLSFRLNISRSCEIIAQQISKEEDFSLELFSKSSEELAKILGKIKQMFKYTLEKTSKNDGKDVYTLAVLAEEDIDKLYWKMKHHTISMMKKKNNKTATVHGLVFLDIIKELEHIGDDLQKIISLNNNDENIF